MPSAWKLWGPVVAATLLAAGLASNVLLPASSLAPHFALIDHDDSVHPLTPTQLSAVRALLGLGSALLAGIAIVLAANRRRIAEFLSQLGEEASAIVAGLRLPETLSFALILLAALALRVAILNGPMQFDESDTFDYFATRSYFNTLSDYTAPNNHILHTLLVRSSYLLFGDSPPAIRLPALVAGMLVLPLTFLLARRLFGETAAYFAMALAAVHPGLVHYSANARGYTLLCTFTLLAFLAASFLREERNRFAWLVFVAAGILGMFTIPVMLYPLSAASLWALWEARTARRKPLVAEIAAAACVIATASVVLYAPAAARSGVEAIVANRYVEPGTLATVVQKLPKLFRTSWPLWTDHFSAPVLLLLGAAALAGLRSSESRRLAAVLVGTAGLWMAVQRVVPFARVFMYAAPLFCVIAGQGLRSLLPKPKLAPVLAGLLAIHYYVGYRWFPTPKEQSYRELASLTPRLLQESAPATAVLGAVPFSEPIRYAFLTSGRPRGQVLAPEVTSGGPPSLAKWADVVVVRPVLVDVEEEAVNPGYWVDLDDEAFIGFEPPLPYFQGECIEAWRLSREAEPSERE